MESLDSDELLALSLTSERGEGDDDGGVSTSGSMVGEGGGSSKGGAMRSVGGVVSDGLSCVGGCCVGLGGRFGVMSDIAVGVMSDIVSPGGADGSGGEECWLSGGGRLPFVGQKLFISGSG